MITRRRFLPLLLAAADLRVQALRGAAARAYRVDAVIVLFGHAIASRTGVGEGILLQEEWEEPSAGRLRHLAFAGGSWPERARGLNRFGYFSELIGCGAVRLASYFGFMTVSEEKSLAEAARNLERGDPGVPLAAIRGEVREATHVCALERLRLGTEACWASWRSCLEAAARFLPPERVCAPEENPSTANEATTFLQTVAELLARNTTAPHGRRPFLYGRTQRWLRWKRLPDQKAGEEFRRRGLVASSSGVWRLEAAIESRESAPSRFTLWHSQESDPPLPLRVELQPRSFLRLRFEALPGDAHRLEAEMRAALDSWRPRESLAARMRG